MATKKGIAITIIILAAIAAGSSVIWILPHKSENAITVSGFGNELESVSERHAVIMETMDSNLKSLLNKTIAPDDFITMAQTSSTQTSSLISEILGYNPPSQWARSYINYDEALKKYNDYLAESIALATKMKSGISPSDLSGEISKIGALENETKAFILKSNETRPQV